MSKPGFQYAQRHAERGFFAYAFVNGDGLHERRKNLREKNFSLVDMENLEVESLWKKHVSTVVKIKFYEIVQ